MADPSRAEPPPVVPTSIWGYLQSRLAAVHAEGEMGAFAGPPGIGKTTAIASFARSRAKEIGRVHVRQANAKPTAVMQLMIAAIRDAVGISEHSFQSGVRQTEVCLDRTIKEWRWRLDDHRRTEPVRMTLIFDEAQNLSPELIELVRHWNDGTDSVPPLGIAFSGNDRFRLESGANGPSFLSAATVSRTKRNRKTWTYADVTDDDVECFACSKGIDDPAALAGIVAHCRLSSVNRDLRMLGADLDRALRVAGGRPVNGDLIARLFALN